MDNVELADRGHHNLVDFWRESPNWSSTGQILETSSILLYSTGASSSSYRGAFRLSDSVPAGDLLDQADEFFLARGLSYVVMVRDTGQDDDLRAACAQRRMFSLWGLSPESAVEASSDGAPAPAGVELRQARTAGEVSDLALVCSAAYGLTLDEAEALFSAYDRLLDQPAVTSLVAYLEDSPVAAGQVFMSQGVGGIYWIGVSGSSRGRGIGEFVSRSLTDIAFARGASACTLQSSAQAMSVYRRIGYRTLFNYDAFLRLARRGDH